MSRPLRVDVPDGWYHVMSRGIDQRVIFKDDRDRRSDWGRDVALCLGWRHCGVTFPEPGAAVGRLSAAAAAKAVRRMEERLQQDRTLARLVRKIETTLSIVRT